jgi:hypothetical protein
MGTERMGPPDRMGPPMRDDRPIAPPMQAPPMAPRPVSPMGAPAGPPPRDRGYGRYDEPPFPGDSFDGFESGRHGKTDMTAEIRMTDSGRGPGPGMPPGMRGPGYGGPPGGDYGPPYGGPPGDFGGPGGPGDFGGPPTGEFGGPPGGGFGGPPTGGFGAPSGPPLPPDVHRVDQLRRMFQPRRFGSGYDPTQVDRFFESIIVSMTRSAVPISDAELDGARFSLVPGGYFEAEVDAAIREVKDILRRR